MPWQKIIDLIRGDRAAYTKVIMDGFKDLGEERKKDARERKEENERLSSRLDGLMDEISIMREHEANCQRMLIESNQQLVKNRERLIFIEKVFMKILRDKGIDIELPPPD
jgi:hypothetical protein